MQNKKALVVAISNYAEPSIRDLEGVVQDVRSITNILSKYGFLDIEVLRNDNATSNNIRRALNRLLAGTDAGDVCLFYFSGHGVQIPKSFSGTTDADGSKDEGFLPYEGVTSSVILDNWLADLLKVRLHKEVTFWGLYDCCFSGEIFKLADEQKEVLIQDLVLDALPRRLTLLNSNLTRFSLVEDLTLDNAFHFGAAKSFQPAITSEIDEVKRSVFTWALEQALGTGADLTVGEVEKQVSEKMRSQEAPHESVFTYPPKGENQKIFSSVFSK